MARSWFDSLEGSDLGMEALGSPRVFSVGLRQEAVPAHLSRLECGPAAEAEGRVLGQ